MLILLSRRVLTLAVITSAIAAAALTMVPVARAATDSAQLLNDTFVAIAERAIPGVALIEVKKGPATDAAELEYFFDRPNPFEPPNSRTEETYDKASGFTYATQHRDWTFIVTNNHVVAQAQEIRVRFPDGREFQAALVGTDPKTDIAVLAVRARGLPSLPFGDSSKLRVGEWVVAIGNPFGFRSTLTVGVVSATGRNSVGVAEIENYIQTDAAINPGSSGGVLMDLSGNVIGMNSAIVGNKHTNTGLGFAIPINVVRNIADQLIETGSVARGFFGARVQSLNRDLAAALDLESIRGVLVAQVLADSPAQRTGLRPGDVITHFAAEPVANPASFRRLVSASAPGSVQPVSVARGDSVFEWETTMSSLAAADAANQALAGHAITLGLTVQTITQDFAAQFGVAPDQIVVIGVTPGSVAERANIKVGSVILEVDGESIDSADSFLKETLAASDDRSVLLLVRFGAVQQFVALRW